MRGTIEQVWENQSRNGQRYMNVQIGGERYSVWDTKYFDSMRKGAAVEFEFRQSGNYKHMTDLKVADQPQAPPQQAGGQPNGQPNGQPSGRPNGQANGQANGRPNNYANGDRPPGYLPNNKDRQIARMSCLKSASEILAPVQLDPDAKRSLVIDTARFFERYVFDDDIGAPAQARGDGRAGNGR